jgi:hypothetical protein
MDDASFATLTQISLDQIFLLMQYCGFTYAEAHGLSLDRRRWFIERFNKEQERRAKNNEAQQSTSLNDPIGNLLGLNNPRMPPGQRRF